MSDPNVVTCPLKRVVVVTSVGGEASMAEVGPICDGEKCAWFCAIGGECSVREIARHLGQLAESIGNIEIGPLPPCTTEADTS